MCPAGKEQKATGANLVTTLLDFGQGGHCSYLYVGSDLSAKTVNPDAIVALEDPANHEMRGQNVLFADGHVEWITLPEAMAYLNDLANGINPPKSRLPNGTKVTASEAAAKNDYEKNWRARMPLLTVQGLHAGRSSDGKVGPSH